MIEFLAKHADRTYYSLTLETSVAPVAPITIGPFACLVLNTSSVTPPETQAAISAWLIESGVRYAVCAGVDCSTWDDSIDLALLQRFNYKDVPDSAFVMTTWHAEESIEDILFFLIHNAYFGDFFPSTFLLLQVGHGDALQAFISRLKMYFDGRSFA